MTMNNESITSQLICTIKNMIDELPYGYTVTRMVLLIYIFLRQ